MENLLNRIDSIETVLGTLLCGLCAVSAMGALFLGLKYLFGKKEDVNNQNPWL